MTAKISGSSNDETDNLITEQRLRLLVVDDEPDVRELLVAALGAAGGCHVHAAGDARSALRALDAEETPFDGILLDIQMPGTTGIELCGIIRATPGYGDVPIIMLTAMAERHYLQDAFAKGANDYITKPFEIADLGKKLAKQRTNRLRRKRFKCADSSTASDREVIRCLEDAVAVPGVERCIGREAFQTYLLQSHARFASPVTVRAIKIAQVYDLFSQLPDGEYQATIRRIAQLLSNLTRRTEDVISYFGNGIFLSACVGKSALEEAPLSAGLRRDKGLGKLTDHDLPLNLILGSAVTVDGPTKADVILSLNASIDAAEATEESMSSWGTFREWMAQKMSMRRERSRMEQAAYEQILDDFIESGELGWK